MSALKLEHEQELTQLQQEIDNLSKAKAALELSLNEKKNELESLNDQWVCDCSLCSRMNSEIFVLKLS